MTNFKIVSFEGLNFKVINAILQSFNDISFEKDCIKVFTSIGILFIYIKDTDIEFEQTIITKLELFDGIEDKWGVSDFLNDNKERYVNDLYNTFKWLSNNQIIENIEEHGLEAYYQQDSSMFEETLETIFENHPFVYL